MLSLCAPLQAAIHSTRVAGFPSDPALVRHRESQEVPAAGGTGPFASTVQCWRWVGDDVHAGSRGFYGVKSERDLLKEYVRTWKERLL